MANVGENSASVQDELFRSLLKTPHRKVDEIIEVHKAQFERDPNFYGKLAVYAAHQGNCPIRDVNEVFIACLFRSPYPEHREAAYVMLQSLPPYEVVRVLHYLKGYDDVEKHFSYNPPLKREFGVTFEPAKHSRYFPDEAKRGKVIEPKTVKLSKKARAKLASRGIAVTGDNFTVNTLLVHHAGFGANINRWVQRALGSYVAYREAPDRLMMLESALLRARKYMKEIYVRARKIPLGDEKSWLNRFLFHDEAPEGSRLAALKLLMDEPDPTKQAEIIMTNKIPYPVVVTLVKNITPSVLVAMIDAMSPQELLSNMGQLTKRGATKDLEIKKLIEEKLQKSKSAKKARVDALKGAFAATQAEGLDADLAKIMTEVTDVQLKSHGTIRPRTAIIIDNSSSMEPAIELAKTVGATLGQACESLIAFTCNNLPTEIPLTFDTKTKSGWDQGLRMVRASGGTDLSQAVRALTVAKRPVDQILLISDECENTEGRFATAVKEYEKVVGLSPNVVILRVRGNEGGGSSDRIERTCKAKDIVVDVQPCDKIDQVSIPTLLSLLSRKSVFELLMDIQALPLPTRAEWDAKNLAPKKTEKAAAKV